MGSIPILGTLLKAPPKPPPVVLPPVPELPPPVTAAPAEPEKLKEAKAAILDVPTRADPEIAEAVRKQQAEQKKRKGRAATILTAPSGSGLGDVAVNRPGITTTAKLG